MISAKHLKDNVGPPKINKGKAILRFRLGYNVVLISHSVSLLILGWKASTILAGS